MGGDDYMKKIGLVVLLLIGANILILLSKLIFGITIQSYGDHSTSLLFDVAHIGIWVAVFVTYVKKFRSNKDRR